VGVSGYFSVDWVFDKFWDFPSSELKGNKRLIGRKVSILMILPCLLLFVPIINNENFQLEGVFLIVIVGFFFKDSSITRCKIFGH